MADHYSMGDGHLDIGGREFAIGLTWGLIQRARAKETARKMAQDSGHDLFCLNTSLEDGASAQCGLGSTGNGQKSKMPPLATSILQKVGSLNLLVCIRTDRNDDEFYLVAIQGGAILSGYDGIVEGQQAARKTLDNLLSADSVWDDVFISDEFDDGSVNTLTHGEETEITVTTLIDLISGEKRFRITLQGANGSGVQNYILLGLIGCVILGAIYSVYHRHVEAERKARELQEMRNRQKLHKKVGIIIPLPVFPWEGIVHGIYPIDACIQAIKQTPIILAGWETKNVTCQPVENSDPTDNKWEIASTISRTYGKISWLSYQFNRTGVHFSIHESGKNIVASRPVSFQFPKANVMGHNVATSDTVSVRRYLIENVQEKGVGLTQDTIVGTTFRKPGLHGKADKFSIEKHVSFSFNTALDPVTLYPYLAALPALRAEEVIFDPEKWEWRVSGTAYERLPIPTVVGVTFRQETLAEHKAKFAAEVQPEDEKNKQGARTPPAPMGNKAREARDAP
ncbi:hypothetical protein AA14337_3044 [Acetobacter malorum DSM 14337]|uniref:Uncharacterized protein n=1 Tax=Acetobacter malorum DSM 14337 TaxID=1307910 RepID=A0ABQ0PZB3_9PROT|nr:type 4b pilus protein PilO2 [Acetobacter malorum]KXV05636.1 hypothetical protein AD930_10880 [Acetobacter malorum]GBQ85328.1 hypothetical protein AA14337_3044 [Acetobacter malorum DSM 14337]